MKLNKQGKDEVRKLIEERLKEIQPGTRIKFNKDLIEGLLFETIPINKEECKLMKIPVWSGEFLSKIDLSEVDFTNVSWGILDSAKTDFNSDYYEDIADYDFFSKLRDFPIGSRIIYKNTNAKIDLSKSFEGREFEEINVFNVDFENTSLTVGNGKVAYFDYANLTDTGLKFPYKLELHAFNSNFTNCDLSKILVNPIEVIMTEGNFNSCCLNNTGAKIELDNDTLTERCERIISKDTATIRKEFTDKLKEFMIYNWVDCYFNGKKILSKQEMDTNASELRTEYEQYKSGIIADVNALVDEQVHKKKK